MENAPIDTDDDFQRRESIAEKIGWLLMGCLAIASLIGLFGEGPQSEKSLSKNGVSITYNHFVRNRAETSLEIVYHQSQSSRLTVAFNNDYLFNLELKSILPKPEIIAADHQTIFVFPTDSRSGEKRIRFFFEPQSFGRYTANISVKEDTTFSFDQIIYP